MAGHEPPRGTAGGVGGDVTRGARLDPRSTRWFTRLGSASLVVYLFHGFFIKGASYAGFADWAADRPVLSLVVATLGGVAISLLLSWRPVRKPLEKVITPSP